MKGHAKCLCGSVALEVEYASNEVCTGQAAQDTFI